MIMIMNQDMTYLSSSQDDEQDDVVDPPSSGEVSSVPSDVSEVITGDPSPPTATVF